MSDVSYLSFSMLLVPHLLLATIKSKPGGWINICSILLVWIRHFLRHQYPIQNSGKLDLRTTRINLLQDNTEIIDRHKNWNITLFKKALEIKGSD